MFKSALNAVITERIHKIQSLVKNTLVFLYFHIKRIIKYPLLSFLSRLVKKFNSHLPKEKQPVVDVKETDEIKIPVLGILNVPFSICEELQQVAENLLNKTNHL